MRNGLSTGKAFCHLVERLSVRLYRYNAKMILCFRALHPHSEDDWLQGCSVEEDGDLPQGVVEGDDSQLCANVSEQSWTEVSSGLCRDNTVSDNNFPSAFPVTNRFSPLSVEYASLDPKDAVPQDVGIEDSHFQFTFASPQGAVTTKNIGPTDFELLEETIAAVAEQKTLHLVTSAPPDTVNFPLVVADGIAFETLCDGQPHDLRHSSYRAHYLLELPLIIRPQLVVDL